jgi:hypothetical protein
VIGWLLRLIGLVRGPLYVVELEVSGPEPWESTTIRTVTTTSLADALCVAAKLDRDYDRDQDVAVQIRKAA